MNSAWDWGGTTSSRAPVRTRVGMARSGGAVAGLVHGLDQADDGVDAGLADVERVLAELDQGRILSEAWMPRPPPVSLAQGATRPAMVRARR